MKTTFLFMITLLTTGLALQSCDKEVADPLHSTQYRELNSAMRVLWSDHALWTRNVIINIIDGAPGTDEAVARLLHNQEDIGNALVPYYGADAGLAMTNLLKTHITTAADLLIAAKSGDSGAFDIARTSWYANGDDIATFLNAANPNHWDLDEMKSMMKSHLDLTLNEAVARLNGDYAADVMAYDQIYAQLMEMADMLSEGIAHQFPEKF